MSARSCESLLRDVISGQLTIGNRLINSRKVLENDATRTQVQMPDFRVAHLAFGETNIGTTSAQFATRIITIELVVKGGVGKKGGVAILLARLLAAGIDPP